MFGIRKGEEYNTEDESSDNEDIVLPQERNNVYVSYYKLNNNTHETNQYEVKILFYICQEDMVDDSYAMLQKTLMESM